jgi:hypothetical protein
MASPNIQLAKSMEKLSARNLQMLSIIAGFYHLFREPQEKMIHIKPKNVAAGYARRNIFGFYYFL